MSLPLRPWPYLKGFQLREVKEGVRTGEPDTLELWLYKPEKAVLKGASFSTHEKSLVLQLEQPVNRKNYILCIDGRVYQAFCDSFGLKLPETRIPFERAKPLAFLRDRKNKKSAIEAQLAAFNSQMKEALSKVDFVPKLVAFLRAQMEKNVKNPAAD